MSDRTPRASRPKGRHSGARAAAPRTRVPRLRGHQRARRETRPPRRLRPPGRRGSITAAVVVLVAAALVGAGTVPRAEHPHGRHTRTAATALDLSCLGRIPGTDAWTGSLRPSAAGAFVDDRPLKTRVDTPVRRHPVRLHAEPPATAWSYAVRATGRDGWAAAGDCPPVRAQWWFVGAGASLRHGAVLSLDNPREGIAVVDIEVFGPDGAVEAPGLRGVQVESRRTVHLDLARVAPALGDLAVHVRAQRGLVAASIAERWSPSATVEPSREWVSPQPPPRRVQTVVGVLPRPPHATLLLANPSQREAVVKLAFLNDSGSFTRPGHHAITVPPRTVLPVDIDDALKSAPLAVRLTSQVPLSATVRSWSGSDDVYAAAAQPLGRRSVAGVPGRMAARLQLSTTARSGQDSGHARFRVIGYGRHGQVVGHRRVRLAVPAAASVSLWRSTTAVSVRALDEDATHARAVLLVHRGRGHYGLVPLRSADTRTRVPVVEPGW